MIGLSAGLLAPVIGVGLGSVFGTIGISGATTFLAGSAGAAVISVFLFRFCLRWLGEADH